MEEKELTITIRVPTHNQLKKKVEIKGIMDLDVEFVLEDSTREINPMLENADRDKLINDEFTDFFLDLSRGKVNGRKVNFARYFR